MGEWPGNAARYIRDRRQRGSVRDAPPSTQPAACARYAGPTAPCTPPPSTTSTAHATTPTTSTSRPSAPPATMPRLRAKRRPHGGVRSTRHPDRAHNGERSATAWRLLGSPITSYGAAGAPRPPADQACVAHGWRHLDVTKSHGGAPLGAAAGSEVPVWVMQGAACRATNAPTTMEL
jgi:hypothetical protein